MPLSIQTLLKRGVAEVIERSHLEKVLRSGRKLRVKLGIDPTRSDLHFGHMVVLRKLRHFQEAGHQAVLIIGDFTAQIGDPSGQSETRQVLTEKQIKANLKSYLQQAGRIIDLKKVEIRYNSEWFRGQQNLILELASKFSLQQTLKREDFQKRLAEGKELTILEALYAVFQGYDSVMIKADLEIGGADQKLNMLFGRKVQRRFGLPEQDILTVPLLEGTDGVRKMSKSFGNYIGIAEPPQEMFNKIMAISDSLIDKYFDLLTDIDRPKNVGPREAKMILAFEIVKNLHSIQAARLTQQEFIKVFSKKQTPSIIPILKVTRRRLSLLDLMIQAGVKSKSEARRLINQGAVEIKGQVKKNSEEILFLEQGDVLKIGKKRFFKIKLV